MNSLIKECNDAQNAYDRAWDDFLNADTEYIDAATYALKAAEVKYDAVIQRMKEVEAVGNNRNGENGL